MSSFIKLLFYGNYFYGICAIALSVEAAVQQKIPLNNFTYFILLFCITVVYYTKAYLTNNSGYPSNERDLWYSKNKTQIKISQIILIIISMLTFFILLSKNIESVKNLNSISFVLFLIFPVISVLYYGIGTKFNLRNIGWMKPFVIGFAWAGIVTVYPAIFYSLENQIEYKPDLVGILLFLKNFMFISVLCIMFDVKDYATDSNQKLNTFVVKAGLRKTIFFIIIPLCLIGLTTFIIFALTKNFHPLKITLNVIPFLLLIMAGLSLKERKNLMYYLIYIDGLMLVKGICGTLAMTYF